jgi:hypothetical protein
MAKIVDIDLLSFQNYNYSVVESNKSKHSPSISKRIHAGLAAIMEAPFFLFSGQTQSPIFKGPHWATLTVAVSLASNIPFVLCCEIKDGELLPRLAGLSKDTILEYLHFNQNVEFFHMLYQFMILAFFSQFILGPILTKVKVKVRKWL